MPTLTLATTYVDEFLSTRNLKPKISIEEAHTSLQNKTCQGAEYLGWMDLPLDMTDEKIREIQDFTQELRKNADVLIVCGIGGSYLWARALLEAFSDPYESSLSGKVVFLWNHLSGREYERIFTQYREERVVACIISKSGTTMETAISYRLVRDFLLSKYSPEEVQRRIVTITDETHGALRAETEKEVYKSYVLPGNIGGRYSVLTPVGLVPCAFAGIDIQGLIDGARQARHDINSTKAPLSRGDACKAGGFFSEWNNPPIEVWITPPLDRGATDLHPAFAYALKRVLLEQSWFVSELFITAEPSLYFLGEWWKQLMGESHGKEGTGLYPDTLTYTTDLHSLGQYVQEGRRLFFETMLWIDSPLAPTTIPVMKNMADWLDPLVGRTLHEMNLIALESTA